MMSVLLVLSVAGTVVGSAVIARHRAQGAADLAALAAAGRLASGSQAACASADALARSADATVSSCSVQDLDVIVAVEVRVALGRWGLQAARAQARAGPDG
jgi:secretion/DNA translocation related TadE-like protein